MIVYKATNIINGKLYIGKTTKSLNIRIKGHLRKVNNNYNNYFYNAIRKYGEDNFTWEILYNTTNLNILNKKEKYFIKLLNTNDKNIGYNLTEGGEGGDTFTNNPNKELIREKCGRSMLGKKHSKKSIMLMKKYGGQAWKGKKQPQEMIDKRRVKLKGRVSPMKNRNQSEKAKKLISKNNAKYWSGKHHTEETKNKLREKRKLQDMSYRCQQYLLISPENEKFIVSDGLAKFCEKHDLDRSKLVLVAQNKRNHHKKWKCSYNSCI